MTTRTSMGSLQELQRLDTRIRSVEEHIAAYEPRLAEVEDPALQLESELKAVEDRLEEMRADTRRLERSVDDKRARIGKLEERLNQVQNLREEAAVRTELDLIRRAVETDEQEALQLLDQAQRAEIAADELREKAGQARAEVAPSQEALQAERAALESELEELQGRRDSLLEGVGPEERRVYDSFHSSGRKVVVAPLLDDGACGNCFGMVPLQVQNEIRHAETLVRCEACGVILSAELEPEPAAVAEEPTPEPGDESDEG
jgi:predicted  nucleic acid-binding Zn-ribbon protein